MSLPTDVVKIDPVLTLADVSAATTLSRSEIYRRVAAEAFPRQIQLGPNRVGWRASAVADWLASREVRDHIAGNPAARVEAKGRSPPTPQT